MMSVVGLNTSNLNIKRGILCTWISWQLTHQSLPMRSTPWRQTTGSAPQSPCSGYSTVQSIKRLCTQHNNLEAQLEPSGLLTSLPYLLITITHGASFVLLSMLVTYPTGLLHSKLKEFLDLEQGNHSMFDYTR
jgi:hypothetical protein